MHDTNPDLAPSASQDPMPDGESLPSLDSVTRRMSTKALERGGIRSIRVLNESLFQEVLEKIVKERIQVRLAALGNGEREPAEGLPEPPPGAQAKRLEEIESEYRFRWDEFRSYYEDKLLKVEEALRALIEAPQHIG